MIIRPAALAFDDVLLIPGYSEIKSRRDPSTLTRIGPLELSLPIISSPMDTVTEDRMANAIEEFGGLGVIHRFLTPEKQLKMLQKLNGKVVPAIGVTKAEKDRFVYLYDNIKMDMVSIDIANGHSSLMAEMIDFVKSIDPTLPIMAGNVATGAGYRFLANKGVNAIRAGVGGGSICKTRIQTGFGIPTLQTIIDCYATKLAYGLKASIIADGGIRYPKDLVKSLVAGADAIMAGGILAGTKEAPGGIIYTNDKRAWKRYRGMASAEVQNDKRGGLKPGTVAEGVSTLTPYTGSLERVITEFSGGLRSGMSYGNARTIEELRSVDMITVTNSGISESHAYGTRK